jgi:outer membrane lipoprotein-sorting protein
LDYEKPELKTLVIDKGKVLIYQPKINRLQEIGLGKNRAEAEFFTIGFGSGSGLTKKYNVAFVKEETINAQQTSLLDLTPKSSTVSAMFAKILLWMDHTRWIPIQMRFIEASGDHLTVEFENIQLNTKLADKIFKLNLPSNVERVKPVSS